MPPPASLSAGGKHRDHTHNNVTKPDVKWEKVLWRRQPFPDNYVPPSFLAELDELRTCLGCVGGDALTCSSKA